MIDKGALFARLRAGTLQIVTIVFSVSVALQFQDCHERSTNARIGRNALTQIEEEIAFNRRNVAKSVWQLHDIVETMRARGDEPKTHEVQFDYQLSLPAFFSGAYDSAVSAGSMRHLAAERAATIARVYRLQNWMALIQEHVLQLDLDPLIALAPDNPENRYNLWLLTRHSYEKLERNFQELLLFYDALIADRPLPIGD